MVGLVIDIQGPPIFSVFKNHISILRTLRRIELYNYHENNVFIRGSSTDVMKHDDLIYLQ